MEVLLPIQSGEETIEYTVQHSELPRTFRNKASGKEMQVLPLRQGEEETIDLP